MPWRFVIQPNGKFAQFSTIVDNFIAYDFTEEEAFAEARKTMGHNDAFAKVDRARREADPYSPGISREPLARYREAMDTIWEIHGKAEWLKVIDLMGYPAAAMSTNAKTPPG